MPHKKKPRRYITPLVLFTLAGWALWALGRNEPDDRGDGRRARQQSGPTAPVATRRARPGASAGSPRASPSPRCSSAAPPSRPVPATSWPSALEGGETTTEVTSTEEAPSEEPAAGRGGESGEEGEQPAEPASPKAARSRRGRAARRRRGASPATARRARRGRDSGRSRRWLRPAASSPATASENPGDGEPRRLRSPDEPATTATARRRRSRPIPASATAPATARPPPGDLPVIDKQTRSPALPRSRGRRRRLLRHHLAAPPAARPDPAGQAPEARLRPRPRPRGDPGEGRLGARAGRPPRPRVRLELDEPRPRADAPPDSWPSFATVTGRPLGAGPRLRRRRVRQGGVRPAQLQPRGRPTLPRRRLRGLEGPAAAHGRCATSACHIYPGRPPRRRARPGRRPHPRAPALPGGGPRAGHRLEPHHRPSASTPARA